VVFVWFVSPFFIMLLQHHSLRAAEYRIRIFAKSSRNALAVMQNRVLSLPDGLRKPCCIRTFPPFHFLIPVFMPSGHVLALFAFVQKHDFISR
jgi:hypothetical protein